MANKKPIPKRIAPPKKVTGNSSKFISVHSKRIFFNDVEEDYLIGDLLIKFLDLDFREFEQRRQKVLANYISKDKSKDGHAYVLDWISKEIEDLQNQHPYFRIIDKDALKVLDCQELLTNTFDLLKIQNLFKSAVEFCLCAGYMDELESLSTSQRYYIYHVMNNSPFEKIGAYETVVNEPMNIKGGKTLNIETPNIPDLIRLLKNGEDLYTEKQYYGLNIASLLYVEFSKMVALDINVKVCEYCGHFFMSMRPARYCNRQVEGTEYTCRTISTARNYKDKLSDDQDYRLYRAAYKRLNVRKNKGLITIETYSDLIKKIADIRRDFQEGKISSCDYKEHMDGI